MIILNALFLKRFNLCSQTILEILTDQMSHSPDLIFSARQNSSSNLKQFRKSSDPRIASDTQ